MDVNMNGGRMEMGWSIYVLGRKYNGEGWKRYELSTEPKVRTYKRIAEPHFLN